MKEILLSQEKLALVDESLFDQLSQWKWCVQKNGRIYYAVRRASNNKLILMHHEVFGACIRLDHIDGDGLNNQLANLRIASAVENSRNVRKQDNCSSIYKGVHWHKSACKWSTQIRSGELLSNGRHRSVYLGLFEDEIEAARVYDRAALEHFGEFAKLNFPKDTG